MSYNRLEDTIKEIYTKLDVFHPRQLDIELIASRLGFSIAYIHGISKYIESIKTICIKKSLSREEQWQDFGHELCHALWHAGNQMSMPIDWRHYQEWQANSFSFEACVPRFLLEAELKENPTVHPINLISEKFGVTNEFAFERYLIHIRKMTQKQSDLLQVVTLY